MVTGRWVLSRGRDGLKPVDTSPPFSLYVDGEGAMLTVVGPLTGWGEVASVSAAKTDAQL